jgi:hypothetical protein
VEGSNGTEGVIAQPVPRALKPQPGTANFPQAGPRPDAAIDVSLLAETPDPDLSARLERIERLASDVRLRNAMAAEDFDGPLYQRFECDLIAYAHAVLVGWMYSGTIFKVLADRGHGVRPSERERTALKADRAAIEGIANMVIALALPRFREQALIKGGWRAEAGAAITTYFMGATVYPFLNEFRSWRNETRRRERERLNISTRPIDTRRGANEDPADVVIREDTLASALIWHKPRAREMVALHLERYSNAEIMEITGAASVRAVEGVLHRWRKAEQARRETRCRHGE